MRKPETKTSAGLPPNTVRFVIDPDNDATVVEVQWRWGSEPSEHDAWIPEVKQDADTLRALALAMLAAELFQRAPVEMANLGTMKASVVRGWWMVKPVTHERTFLDSLGLARERSGSKDKADRGPIGHLLETLDGFGDWWRATRAKGKKVGKERSCFKTKNPNASGASARPVLHFQIGSRSTEAPNASELLDLARAIEDRAGGNWAPLFSRAVSPPPPPPSDVAPYLRLVEERCRFVPMRGAEKDDRSKRGDPQCPQGDPDERIELERVFVHLNTKFIPKSERTGHLESESSRMSRLGSEAEDSSPWTALRAVGQPENRHVVVHGGPGSGKSTFIRILMLALSRCGLGRQKDWMPRIAEWPSDEATLIPIRLELRLFAAWMAEQKKNEAKPCHVWDYFMAELGAMRVDRTWRDFRLVLEECARQGRTIFFLDGLDEVPTVPRKILVRDCVQAFAESGIGSTCRIVVTCRTKAYDTKLKRGANLHLTQRIKNSLERSDWPAYELAGFTADQQAWFVEAWYKALGELETDLRPVVPERTAALKAALKDRQKPQIGQMAETPLLLTVMAHLHSTQVELRLPDNRAELLEDFVDLLLRRWAERYRPKSASAVASDSGETLGELLADPGLEGVTVQLFLQFLARVAHDCFKVGNREKPPLVPETLLLRELKTLHKHEDTPKGAEWAERVMLYIQHRAGLLNSPDGENYDFSHRLIWEYLTAYHLARMHSHEEVAALVSSEDYWDEVVRLVAGHHVFVKNEIAHGLKLVEALCLKARPGSDAVPDVAGWRRVALAADCLHEIGPGKRRHEKLQDKACLVHLQALLPKLMAEGAPSARERARAGMILGHLGDPRLGVMPRDVSDFAETEFCFVPGDPVGGDATPSEGFWIARFPVTVAQFRLFATPENYGSSAWWKAAIDAGFWKDKKVKTTDWKGSNERWESGPAVLESRFDVPNHPVVSVNWFEATAFAAWITRQLQDLSKLPKACTLRLAKDVEWRRAAQGGIMIPLEGAWVVKPLGEGCRVPDALRASWRVNPEPNRKFPWGEEDPGDRANWGPTAIRATSAVGCFPAGRSPVGAEEMAGNVWEWTDSWYDEETKKVRALRGGSWDTDLPVALRAVTRNRDRPGLRNVGLGFRLVCVGESL